MEQIDILMATYNGEKYLKEQIESILNQTYKNIRLIISDDCSTDKTKEILKEYEKNDKRVIVYFQKNNLGYVKNFNFLLTKVENDIYMLSDQDDIWLPTKVSNSYNFLKQNNADLVFTDLLVVNKNGETINNSFNKLMKLTKKITKTIGTYKLTYLYNCVTGCTIMSKKEYLKYIIDIPTNSKHIFHDHWIALVISLKGNIKYLPEALIRYRQHGDNQVGAKHTINKFNTFDEIRNHFIDVKLGIFGTYVENSNIFTEDLKKLNEKAYNYYKMISKKKNVNFKNWTIFHTLYKNENFKYYIENFLILNIPWLVRMIMKIRKK